MDFIDWCHHVLRTMESERFNPHLDTYTLQQILFKEATEQPNFHTSNIRHSMFHALTALTDAGLVEEENRRLKITQLGRKVLSDPTALWTEICEQEIFDPAEIQMLRLINRLSPHVEDNPECVWLEDIEFAPILREFDVEAPPPKSNEHQRALQKYLYDLPKLLADRRFLIAKGRIGYDTRIKPTYQGLVWETRREFTIESRFLDGLVKDWETTNVDFKRDFGLDTQKQKGEFAKDALGLATTKSSGQRFMIFGFDDKTRQYHGPPDAKVTQNRMEQVLANLTEPVVTIKYEIVDYRLGKVGKLELIREPEKLPYRATQDVLDEKGKRVLEKGKVYVRHGSQTEGPTDPELEALDDEGRRARGE